jgi:bifunctional UDP-N-acetylglucosamine pyrophosphorylase/glucosamine-1-phosphate N-acetyltransferase
MSSPTITAVILAAGKGTRMKSNKAKVLHELFFKPMLHHVLDSVAGAAIDNTAIIVGHQRQQVLETLTQYTFTPVFQEEQLGTGHAVLCAEEACAQSEQVMILCGDTPLIRASTLEEMVHQHQDSNALLTLMTTALDDPFGYGRIICDNNGYVTQIVEQKDADAQQRLINEINAGIYLVDTDFLFSTLKQVGTDNNQGEMYLTDIVAIAASQGHKVHKFRHTTAIDVLGVNSRIELAKAHQELQVRHNQEVMLQGITMYSPDTTLISPDSTIGQDSIIEPGVQVINNTIIGQEVRLACGVILDNCKVGDNCTIGPYSVIRNCRVEDQTSIAPLSQKNC